MGKNPRINHRFYPVEQEISSLPTSSHFIWSMHSVRSGSRIVPNLFQIYSDDDHLFSNCLVCPVTDMALSNYLSKYKTKLLAGPHKLYKFLEREPKLSYTNKYIFQWACDEFFRSLEECRSFPVRSLDDPRKSITWQYPDNHAGYSKSHLSELQTQIEGGTPGHVIHPYTTFPTFNYMVYTPDGFEFVQMTTGVDYAGSTTGFERVQRWLDRIGENSQHLQPSTTRRWKFIFVVPEEIAPSFTKWTFGDGWDEKVAQYVLGLSQRQIWGR
jgi:hypothetical protein